VTDSVVLQIVSRNMTNLTPAQLEQFESTFRYFDKDETNTLTVSELSAALASLGIVYSVSLFKMPLEKMTTQAESRTKISMSYISSWKRSTGQQRLRLLLISW
jgi:Ca2+-binding EF-hand superfamily protein